MVASRKRKMIVWRLQTFTKTYRRTQKMVNSVPNSPRSFPSTGRRRGIKNRVTFRGRYNQGKGAFSFRLFCCGKREDGGKIPKKEEEEGTFRGSDGKKHLMVLFPLLGGYMLVCGKKTEQKWRKGQLFWRSYGTISQPETKLYLSVPQQKQKVILFLFLASLLS